jgi:hypothetical protein
MGCDSVSSINFPKNITTIIGSAFNACCKLEGALSLPDELTTIYPAAFSRCGENSSGYTLKWNSKIRTISDSCFAGSNLIGELTFPSGITSLPQDVFYNTNITKVTINSNINSFGTTPFAHCPKLSEFIISNTRHFAYSANPSTPTSSLTLLYDTPIDPNGSSPSDAGAKVIVPASELSWYKANWPSRLTIEAAP